MIIAFSNLKGGVGKSKLNGYLANYLSEKRNKKVCLVDCDVSQFTSEIYNDTRKDDSLLDIISFDINNKSISENYSSMSELIKACNDVYDYVIVDLPGTLQQDGIFEVYENMDYIFVPTTNSREDVQSSLTFINKMVELGVPYSVMVNNYEVQYNNFKAEEESGFSGLREYFGPELLALGVRKERSLFEFNFALGNYGGHKNTERVEKTFDLLYSKIGE